jgi:hypothetical protein
LTFFSFGIFSFGLFSLNISSFGNLELEKNVEPCMQAEQLANSGEVEWTRI